MVYQVVSCGSEILKRRPGDQHDRRAADSSAKREGEARQRKGMGMCADHQRKTQKRRKRSDCPPPTDPLDAEQGAEQPGEQRIDEIAQDRDWHGHPRDRGEQAKDNAGEQHAEAERNPPGSRGVRTRRRSDTQPDEQQGGADEAAKQRKREHVSAR